MEYFCTGWPDLWAVVKGEPYIVADCGWDTEIETTQSFGGTNVVAAQSINGFAKLFGKERFEVYDKQGVPEPIDMQIAGNGETTVFQQTMFSSLEWVAESIEKKQSEQLNRVRA